MANMRHSEKLKLVSYNCKHFKSQGPKHDFMKELMNECDFMFIQEHCLHQSHLYKLKSLGEHVDMTGTSAMDENVQLYGRPHGGCAIVYKSDIMCDITEIQCNHNRLCGVTLKMKDVVLLALCAYMPCDTNRHDDNFAIYMEVISRVEQLMQNINPSHVIFGGDLNTDLIRVSPQTRALSVFMSDFDMTSCIEMDLATVPYTYIGPTSTSKIDHFIVSPAMASCVSSCEIIDNHLFSDHVPVKTTFDFNIDVMSITDRPHQSKTAWWKASSEQLLEYKYVLEQKLKNIKVDHDLLSCTDISCTVHIESLKVFYASIINACIEASDQCIPKTGKSNNGSSNRNIPGWTEHVEHFRQESLYWHHQWRDSGQPHHGQVAEMRRITRARYHRALRHVIKDGDSIKMERMAQAIIDNRTRDLYTEVRKIKGRNNFAPANVDGYSNVSDISDVFSNKYKNLYNSVPYDNQRMKDIINEIDEKLHVSNNVALYSVSVHDVINAIKSLKSGKAGGIECLNSDHIIHGPHILYVLLTNAINCMLVHGVSPDSMITGTMVPIPKCKRKLLCCSDNYRAITLSSIIGKILDLVILIKEEIALNSCDQQFGFKSNVSTTQCTFVLNETISYYNSKRSNVYVALLDATKAFDRVNYCKLFRKLVDRNMSPIVLRLLLYMYTHQKLQVRWGNHTGNIFSVKNGVKQGGVLSPILFSAYLDDLLCRLKKRGVGCHMGNYFVGCLAYADDLTLIAPSRKALQIMISICEGYALDYDVIFNGPKTLFLIFQGRDCNVTKCSITVNNESIDSVNEGLHLGHCVSSVNKYSLTEKACAQFWKFFNLFTADFGHIYPFLQCKLFGQYCCSFYGSPLWSFKSYDTICVAWRKALRKLWRVSPRTHCEIIALLSDSKPLEKSLMQRFCRFGNSIFTKGSPLIKNVATIAMNNPFSVFGTNYCAIKNMYNLDLSVSFKMIDVEWNDSVSDDVRCNVSVLRDMIDIRDKYKECELISIEDAIHIIDEICIN